MRNPAFLPPEEFDACGRKDPKRDCRLHLEEHCLVVTGNGSSHCHSRLAVGGRGVWLRIWVSHLPLQKAQSSKDAQHINITCEIMRLAVRMVMDTNVVVSGLRSPSGASAKLVDQALARRFTPLLSVALALEYEATCCDPVQLSACGLSETDVQAIISALCVVAEPVVTRFLWRPQLRDPSDEMVLEAAINGGADALVTCNQRDFGDAPREFGIALLAPQGALRRLSA